MKKKYSLLRELWAVPKYRTLFKLGGYLLFFIIFFTIASFNPKHILNTNRPKVMSYSTLKEELINSNLRIKYKITSTNNYFLEGTIIDEELLGTLEYNDELKKIKIDKDKVYIVQKNEEYIEKKIFSDINIIYLFPHNIFQILEENSSLLKISDDNKTYNYGIDNKSYSIFLNNNQIEKIIILDSLITYTFEYSLIK
ncbi:MAG: hypothetical protein PHF21_03350 [Bacilli bacterium]|nr:hypothetical protein [Bacilli bacterium]